MTINKTTLASVIRQIGAVAALVVGSLQDSNTVPGKYGWVLQLVGGVILAVEHALNGNQIPTPPTGTPSATVPTGVVGPS